MKYAWSEIIEIIIVERDYDKAIKAYMENTDISEVVATESVFELMRSFQNACKHFIQSAEYKEK